MGSVRGVLNKDSRPINHFFSWAQNHPPWSLVSRHELPRFSKCRFLRYFLLVEPATKNRGVERSILSEATR